MSAIVEVEGIARSFGETQALCGVDLSVPEGGVVALLGPNGAGKTTLLRLLATAIRPSYGSAAVDGLDVGRDVQLVRERVAYLSHATGLYDDLTARENLEFAATMLSTPHSSARVARALDDVGLASRADDRVGSFSAGMRRRLALGRILLGQASLVLLDEPTAALDADGFALVEQLLEAWREAGVSVLMASHSTDRLERWVDAHVVLDRGLVSEVSGVGVTWAPPTPIGDPQPATAAR
jgi:heme ABC exporter ATP-binding subunit CcmA